MPGKSWSSEEVEILEKYGPIKGCEFVANKIQRTVKSVQHKYHKLGLKKVRAKVGDIIKGWKILEIFTEHTGNQNIRMAKIVSTLEDKTEKCTRLTLLTNHQIGWPDRRRPDLSERNRTHGESKTRLYRIWSGMKNRCTNEKQPCYKDYGGRGIEVCDEWSSYENFRDWAKANGYNKELSLDRINVDDNYTPENCKWVTWKEQSWNKQGSDETIITAFGESKTIYEWCDDSRCTVSVSALRYRIHAKWDTEDAFIRPSERKSKIPLKDWLIENYSELYQEYINS